MHGPWPGGPSKEHAHCIAYDRHGHKTSCTAMLRPREATTRDRETADTGHRPITTFRVPGNHGFAHASARPTVSAQPQAFVQPATAAVSEHAFAPFQRDPCLSQDTPLRCTSTPRRTNVYERSAPSRQGRRPTTARAPSQNERPFQHQRAVRPGRTAAPGRPLARPGAET
jgi:hypothetical protein